MRALERTLQWLRPLVQAKAWDCCVVWKLGDDPSRYFEWVGGCCSGAHSDCKNVKEEKQEQGQLVPLCRDTHIKHPVKTKACLALSHFPSSIPLYSGIHGEAVLSTEPRWISCTEDSNPNQWHESTGTHVLIPVACGLIELFSTKHIFRDEKVIEFVTAQFKITMEQEVSDSNTSVNGHPRDALPNEYLHNWPHPLQDLILVPTRPFLSLTPQTNHHPSYEGSSMGSNPSVERPSFNDSGSVRVSPNGSVNETTKKCSTHNNSNSNRNLSSKQESEPLLEYSNQLVEKDKLKSKQRMEREQYQSKNLVTERNRRNRIRDGLFALRALVPKISKMDRTAILGDAIEYIEELQKKRKELKDEIGEIEAEENKKENDKCKKPESNANKDTITSTPSGHNHDPSNEEKMEVQVEVYQIGARDFLLKLLCKQKQGGFMRLMEGLNSNGLQVIDANVSTYSGKVLNILKVEVNTMEAKPTSLRDLLIKLISKTHQ